MVPNFLHKVSHIFLFIFIRFPSSWYHIKDILLLLESRWYGLWGWFWVVTTTWGHIETVFGHVALFSTLNKHGLYRTFKFVMSVNHTHKSWFKYLNFVPVKPLYFIYHASGLILKMFPSLAHDIQSVRYFWGTILHFLVS